MFFKTISPPVGDHNRKQDLQKYLFRRAAPDKVKSDLFSGGVQDIKLPRLVDDLEFQLIQHLLKGELPTPSCRILLPPGQTRGARQTHGLFAVPKKNAPEMLLLL